MSHINWVKAAVPLMVFSEYFIRNHYFQLLKWGPQPIMLNPALCEVSRKDFRWNPR